MKELDKRFLDYLSPRLLRFHWEKDTVCNFRCPLCGDSKKSQSKARGYFIFDRELDEYRYKCHNCGEKTGWTFGYWLKDFDPNLYSEYAMEKFQSMGNEKPRPLQPLRRPQTTTPQTVKLINRETKRDDSLLGGMVRLDYLPESHFVRQYVVNRRIPEKFLSMLYYTKNYQQDLLEFEKDPEKRLKMPQDERLVIPFWTREGRMKLVQGRAFDDSALRYVTTKPDDNDTKVYGEDRLVRGKMVMAVEGPIDSMFLPNCLASADANILSVKADIYVPDNQYRNPQVCGIIENIIKSGVKVVLFPPSVPWKDINDMVHPEKGNMDLKTLLTLMGKNVYQGMTAELKFASLRRA